MTPISQSFYAAAPRIAITLRSSETLIDVCVLSNGRVELQADQIQAHAKHAQSLNRSSAATIGMWQRAG